MTNFSGVRVGAAAFVLGVSLAGPVVGVAAADDADVPSVASVSAGQASSDAAVRPRRSASARSGRVANAAGAGLGLIDGGSPARPTGRASVAGAARARVAGSGPVQQGAGAGPSLRALVPVAAVAESGGERAVSSAAVVPEVSVVQVDRSAGRAPVWSSPNALDSVTAGVERVFDVVGQWLSGFSSNPVTEFLAGGLWLVRRTLFPVGSGVGLWGSAGCVASGDCSGLDLTGADFRNQDLTGVRFTNANLNRAYFFNANLTRADLSGATLVHTELAGANLTEANVAGANLKYMDLLGTTLARANLTNANLVGARLWGQTAADLATATVVGADFSGQNFSSGSTLNWSGKDLTGVKLIGANLSGADLSRANLTGAELAGVNLTRANLTDATLPGPSWASPLVSATLTGANLTNVDLSGADLSGKNLAGTVLAGANLARTRLAGADLTGASLVNATLTGANLTEADLTRADLLGAGLIGTTLTDVVWSDTRCSYGSTTSKGCSNVPPPTEPPADWLQAASTRTAPNGKPSPLQWYQYEGPGVEPDINRDTTPTLRGTQGAPLQNRNFSSLGYSNDGVQGVIYNDTGQRIVVRTTFQSPADSAADAFCCSVAILDPGDSVSYQLAEDIIEPDPEPFGGNLEFFRYDNGQTVGDPADLLLWDHQISQPTTAFTPPGRTEPVNERTGWSEEEQHSEIWGTTNIQVKREIDGWRVQGSDTFNKYYRNPNDSATSDWAIFTIRIKSL